MLSAKTLQRVYFVLLALFVCCTLCGTLYADNIAWPKKIDVFASGETQVPIKVGGVDYSITTELFYEPCFLSTDGLMVFFVGGQYIMDGKVMASIVSRYIETKGSNWARNVTLNGGNNWKTQFAMQKRVGNESSNFFLHSPIAATNGNKIYIFVLSFYLSMDTSTNSVFRTFEFHLAMGEIKTNVTTKGTNKIINWQRLDNQSAVLTETVKRELPNAILHAVSNLFVKDGRLTFVLKATINNKDVSLFVSLDEMGNATNVNIFYVHTPDGCYDTCFVLWKSELLMFSKSCLDGKQTVMKSLDMGNMWKTAEPSFVRLLDNLKDKSDINVVTIDNKTALMFTQRVVGETISGKLYEIHLWLSDGNRVRNIGPIAADDKYIFSVGVVYTNGELFFMHQQWDNDKPKRAVLSHLKRKLRRIRFFLNTWNKIDRYLLQPCNMTAERNALSATLCATSVPIDGLVGLLSGGSNNNTYWHDKYLYMNAIVKGGTKVVKGFTFFGAGAGAKWCLEQNGRIPYHVFVQYGLTIVATVSIHSALGNKIPLLTVGGSDWDAERWGLWYGGDRQWKVMSRDGEVVVSAAGAWEVNKTYRVTLKVQDKIISTYINGRYIIGDVLQRPVTDGSTPVFLNIFIAGYEDYGSESTLSNVTVTNVLLYNRQLKETEIRAMSSTLES